MKKSGSNPSKAGPSSPMTGQAASRIQSAAAKQGGVEKGSFPARAQSAAAKGDTATKSPTTGTK